MENRLISQDEDTKKEIIQFVVFTLDEEEYAINIAEAQEIINVPEITSLPNSEDSIKGIFNLRGKIVVAIDLKNKFGLLTENIGSQHHIIISSKDDSYFGLIVDKVVEVVGVTSDEIQPAPTLKNSKIRDDYLDGVIVIDTDKNKDHHEPISVIDASRLIIILRIDKIFDTVDIAVANNIDANQLESNSKEKE